VSRNNVHILLLFLFPLFIFSQKIDSAYIVSTNIKARNLERDGSYTDAYILMNDLISKLNKEDSIYLAFSYQTKAAIERNLGKYKQSINTANSALQICIQLKDTFNIAHNLNLIGIGYYFLSEYDSTKIYYEKSYELKKKINAKDKVLAVSAYNLAILYDDLAQPEKALKLYKDAEHFLLKNKDAQSFLSDVYVGIAHIYRYKGDIDKAEEYSEKALDVGLKSYGEFNPNMTFVYTSYANILERKEKYKESIALLEKSLKIRKSTYGENHKWTCESYYDLANVYAMDKQFEKSEKYYKIAIKLGDKINSYHYMANAQTYLAKKIYIDQNKKLDEAEKLLLSALKKKTAILGYKNDEIAENYFFLAEIFKRRQEKDKFFNSIDYVFNSSGYNKNNLSEVIAPLEVLDALILVSDWYDKKYDNSQKIEFLQNKYNLIDEQVKLIKYTQKNFLSDNSRIEIANEYRDVFEKGLNTCWKLYNETNEDKYLEKAFELSETNRNTTLLEGLQDIKYKLYSGIPNDLLDIEKQTKQKLERVKLDLHYEKIASNPDKDFFSELLNQRIYLSNKLDSLHQSFRTNYPRYANLKFNHKRIKLSDVQKNIDNDTQLLTYFLGEKDLYTFNITKQKITFLKQRVTKDLLEETKNLKYNIVQRKNIEDTSKRLYLFLLSKQIENNKKEMVVIPDNVLNYIPFEILQRENNKYLIEDFTISYSGSVRLYLELQSDYFNYECENYWAGFSPEYKNEKQLPSSSDEISMISKLIDGKTFIGEDSKKQTFLENNKNFSILHLAMHAEIDDENPMFNKLIFSDGYLTSSEIYISESKANLAILSACNTGFGKLEKGEGIMSMARAFHFSGVPSVIMSLWKVPDKETKEIMVYFYKHLKKGSSKSEALKYAKLDYLASTSDINLKHPYYWSGFVLNGNTANLKTTKNKSYYLFGGIIILGLVLLGRIIFKR
jgi:CHAT domain-containing protein/tetratricopeptide (TPR) repeat protein